MADWQQVKDLGGEGASRAGPEGAGGGVHSQGGAAGAVKDGVTGPRAGGEGDLRGDRPAGRHQRHSEHREGVCQGRRTPPPPTIHKERYEG